MFEATENKIKLEANLGQGQPIDADSRIPEFLTDSAGRLVDVAEFLPYSAIGLDFRIAIVDASIDNLVRGIPESAMPKIVRYDVDIEDVSIRMTLNSTRRKSDDAHLVLSNSSGHYDIEAENKSERLEELHRILDRGPESRLRR